MTIYVRMTKQVLFLLVVLSAVTLASAEKYDPCCSFPCLNRGVCIATKNYESYTCDCTGQPFYGENCETPTIGQRLFSLIEPETRLTNYMLTHFSFVWHTVQRIKSLTRAIFKGVFVYKVGFVDNPPLYVTDDHEYTTLDSAKNTSFFARILPPVPKNCPTPLGTKGKKTLPPVQLVVDKLFKRREFIPNTVGANLFFSFMAQFMTHQVLKTDFAKGPGYTWGAHIFDGSQIYGKDNAEEHVLRSHYHGKMKMQTLNGEEYPPYLKDVPKEMVYPDHLYMESDRKFALGHRFFGMIPGLFLFNVIFLREHNRVCDVLRTEYPHWEDERLFQTTKIIMIGISSKVLAQEYLTSIGNFHLENKFDPTVFHGEVFNYATRMFVEFNHLYHWHQLIPDQFVVDDVTYSNDDYLFHNEIVVKHGTANFTRAMVNQRAGEVTLHNHGESTLDIVNRVMQYQRDLRIQSYNEYRKRFHLAPKQSIDDITDNEEDRAILKELYGDADGVEMFVGIMSENRIGNGLFGVTMYDIVAPYAIQAFFSNPLLSPGYWKPSTFGGQVGFDIVKSASLNKLFCGNIPGECPNVFLRSPGDIPENNIANERYPESGNTEL